jgi:hypothetical protein
MAAVWGRFLFTKDVRRVESDNIFNNLLNLKWKNNIKI